MKLNIELNNITMANEGNIERVAINVEYSAEEFISLMTALPDVYKTVMNAIVEISNPK